MCGIFGVKGCDSDAGLEPCARLLTHRGPDQFGSWLDKEANVYLAHCRLSVIDLSDRARQPMSNEDGNVWLTYNGEIYNFVELRAELVERGHVFTSRTDSEVVIHAYEEWGTDCLEKFNGMFAFALWDQRQRRLFLARDRLGIKPLYYAHVGDRFAFASEPKAIIELPFFAKQINHRAVFCFLVYGYVAGAGSVWENIQRLPPGHFLLLDDEAREPVLSQYWRIDPQPTNWPEPDALEHLAELMASSVKYRLVADVPVGVFLSGGTDSTCVASFAAEQAPRINTFSVGFEGWPANELETARESATLFGTTHHEERMTIDGLESLEDVFHFYDEPLGDSSVFPTYLVCQAARQHATVALSGDGGDELFGGYEWYTQTEDCRWLKKLAFMLEPVMRSLGLANSDLGRRCSKLQHYLLMNCPGFRIEELRKLFPHVPSELFPREETHLYAQHYRADLGRYKRWQYVDAMTFMIDNNLTKVDRASMAHSLEVRVPFLDHRIVEFAFSLQDPLCVKQGEKKCLLRRLLGSRGAGHVLSNPKKGFSCPIYTYWPVERMAGEIASGSLVGNGIVDRRAVRDLTENGNMEANGLKIWLLLVLERWCKQWLIR